MSGLYLNFTRPLSFGTSASQSFRTSAPNAHPGNFRSVSAFSALAKPVINHFPRLSPVPAIKRLLGPRFGALTEAQRERAWYGGSFDPFHNDHRAIADAAADQFQLKRVEVVPAFVAYYKNLTPFTHRYEMARRACEDNPVLFVTNVESTLPPPSYTINTMKQLFPGFEERDLEVKLPFITGLDSLLSLPTWRGAKALAKNLVFLVHPRGGLEIPRELDIDGEKVPLNVEILRVAANGHSSTKVRNSVRAGEDIRRMVREPVADYIEEKGLYRENP